MSKPTLEQLKYYLDADLKLIYDGIGGRIVTLETVRTRKECLYISTENGTYEIGKFKPILRPMSDLTKKITIEGEEKIPLVELAKINWPFDSWYIYEGPCGKLARTDSVLNRWFDFEDGAFKVGDDEGNFHVKNQIQLFQWLFKHKFDVFNGIGTWAIDVNTLTENIY